MDDAQHEYVDRVASYFEAVGSPRAWAEILAWLMICEPAEQSQADLASALDLSAGTVSTHVRSLVALELVESTRVRGDRTQRYRLRAGAWTRIVSGQIERVRALGELARLAEPVLPRARPERVTELGDVAGFFEREWPALIARMHIELDKGTS